MPSPEYIIADTKRFILQHGLSRAKFAVLLGISTSSMNKLLSGHQTITPSMLTRIDAKTGILSKSKKMSFDFEIGKPERHITAHLEGRYQVIRPSFREDGHLHGHGIIISYEESLGGLVFEEEDNELSPKNKGCVSIPFNNRMIHLLSCDKGNLRLMTLSDAYQPGLFYGGLLTVASRKMVEKAPAAVIFIMKKLPASQQPVFGIIRPGDDSFADFQALMTFGRVEGFFRMVG